MSSAQARAAAATPASREWWLRRKEAGKKVASNFGKLHMSYCCEGKLGVSLSFSSSFEDATLAAQLAELEAEADNMNQDRARLGFNKQISEQSTASTLSTPSLAELSSPEFFSRQCSEIDLKASKVVFETLVKDAFQAVVSDCHFCVTVADPRDRDFPLIAVSDQFEAMTGFSKAELIGKNCRVLNQGCEVDPIDLISLRAACMTGSSFTAVLNNRRKSGEVFLNLLDLRGLTVAQNPMTGEELWFLVGIQADVTNLTQDETDEINKEHVQQLQDITRCIRAKLVDELTSLAVAGALMSNFEGHEEVSENDVVEGAWCVLPEPTWKQGGYLTSQHALSPMLANPFLGRRSDEANANESSDRLEVYGTEHEQETHRDLHWKLWQVLLFGVGLGGMVLSYRTLWQQSAIQQFKSSSLQRLSE